MIDAEQWLRSEGKQKENKKPLQKRMNKSRRKEVESGITGIAKQH